MTHPRRFSAALLAVAAAAWMPAGARGQGGFSGPGRYEIANVNSGKVIDLDRNNQTTVIQFSSRNTDNQQWDVAAAGDGYWFFRNAMNGAALEAMDNRNSTPLRGTPFTGVPTQQWRIAPAGDGSALIVNRIGKGLDIPNSAVRDGVGINTYDVNGEANQRFLFRRLANLPPSPEDWDREHRWERFYGRFDQREQRWGMQGDGVCFYRQPGFRGRSFCVRAGEEVRRLPDEFFGQFRSLRFFGRVHGVEVFGEEAFGGRRVRFERDQAEVGDMRRIASARVY